MTKFTFEDKLRIILDYKRVECTQSEYAYLKNVTKAQFQYWLRLYEMHEEEGLKSTYTNYTTPFKLDVLNYMAQSGASLMDTAATFKFSSFTMVYQWKKKLEVGGFDALESKKRGRQSMTKDKQTKVTKQVHTEGSVEALQAELERLRARRAST